MNFDQMGKQHVSRRRRPSPLKNTKHSHGSPASLDTSFSQKVWPRPDRPGNHIGSLFDINKNRQQRSSAGFSIPASWFKNMAIVAGMLVVGIVGTNWSSIAEKFRLQEVSPKELLDPVSYNVMESRFEPVGSWEQDTSFEKIPLNLTETFSWTQYEVKQGDTVSGIAAQFSISMGSLIAFNSIKEAWNLRIGKTLKIPNMNGIPHTVEKNDTLSKISVKFRVPQNAILDANDMVSDTIRPGEILFIPGAQMDAADLNRAVNRGAARLMIFPVSGKITSNYGWREDPVNPRYGKPRFHRAVDIAGKMGDPVKAAMKGTVLYLSNDPNLGNFIVLKHGEYQTLYAHLSAYSVRSGETVKQGQEIGKVGNTGYSTGPHLHFAAFRNGDPINPLDLVK